MRIYKNFDLFNYNAYKIRAFCKKAYFPENENDIIRFYSEYTNNQKYIIGNGNNIILSKEFYTEPIIILNDCFNKITVLNDIIIAEAGATMLQLSELALDNSLSGLEMFYDIPSSVGGAVVMNAGADGEEIKDILIKVRYLDLLDLKIKELTRDEIGFEYRNSYFQKNPDKIILKAWLQLTLGNYSDIKANMEIKKQKRWEKQPREYPNCGSVYKRPSGGYVGPMLDELGLKGFSIGGAKISEKHSGFIVNMGNATGKEILALIKEVQIRVKEKYDIDLEVEQRII